EAPPSQDFAGPGGRVFRASPVGDGGKREAPRPARRGSSPHGGPWRRTGVRRGLAAEPRSGEQPDRAGEAHRGPRQPAARGAPDPNGSRLSSGSRGGGETREAGARPGTPGRPEGAALARRPGQGSGQGEVAASPRRGAAGRGQPGPAAAGEGSVA